MHRLFISRQHGSSLVFSLIILTAITLGAIVAMQRSTLQLRMIGNMQHQQSLFNAPVNDFNTVVTKLHKSPVAARTLLGEIIEKEHANIAAGNPLGQINTNPYSQNDPAPVKNVGVSSTSHNIKLRNMPGDNPHSLKDIQGSSAGTLVPYHFKSTIEAKDTKQTVRENQEFGFYYMAPAQQQ